MKKISKKTVIEIVNKYNSINAIKRMQETIMNDYAIEKKKDFVVGILKPAKEIINAAISKNYDGAIAAVTDGQKAAMDAIKRAKSDRNFAREASKLNIDLTSVDFLINTFYPTISKVGDVAHRCYEYLRDNNGDFVLDDKGHRVIVAVWYETTELTANNAAAIIVRCLKSMKRFAKEGTKPAEGWNIVKTGK